MCVRLKFCTNPSMVACYSVSCNNNLLFNIKFKKKSYTKFKILKKIPFLKVLKDGSEYYEPPPPPFIVTRGQLRALKQRDKSIYTYLRLSLRIPV